MTIIQWIGWAGVAFYLVGYFLLVVKRISADKYTYHILNALGAVGLIINAVSLKDNPNIVVNVVWLLMAIYAVCNVFRGVANK
jgi:membrane-bound ClpP family serine protease